MGSGTTPTPSTWSDARSRWATAIAHSRSPSRCASASPRESRAPSCTRSLRAGTETSGSGSRPACCRSGRARVLSARGIAVAWITLDRFGERTTYQPATMNDPVFYLRRVGGGLSHVWRAFRTRAEAIIYLSETYGAETEGVGWARALPIQTFDDLVNRYGRYP